MTKPAVRVILECGHKRSVFNVEAKIKKQEKVFCIPCDNDKKVISRT